MQAYRLNLGYADDPTFKWEGGDYNGNIPQVIVSFGSIGLPGCVEARVLLESTKYGGHKLDWGASGARLNKFQVINFLTEFYSNKLEQENKINNLARMPEDRLYLLFACEE